MSAEANTIPTSFESDDGLVLEAALHSPAGAPRGSLAFCHPHPKMGGTMNAPLLITLTDELVARGWAVLRFNFRGIGRSGGEPSTGEAEVADAAGAISFLTRQAPEGPIVIAGWSFGGAVAIRTLSERADIAAGVVIAPAIRARPGITAGTPEPSRLTLGRPLLVVCGANDDQVSPSDCAEWAASAPGARYVEMPGANHFFWAKYDALAATVTSFLDETFPKPPPSSRRDRP